MSKDALIKRQRSVPNFEPKLEYYLLECDFEDNKKQLAFNKDAREFWAKLTGKRPHDLVYQSPFSTIHIEEISKRSRTHKLLFLYDCKTANTVYELALKHEPVFLRLHKTTLLR